MANYKLSGTLNNKLLANQDIHNGLRTMGTAMNRINNAFKKDFQSMKNLTEYEKLQQKIEMQKKDMDIDM